jgi:predicted RNase H-like nuclease
MSLIIGVDGCKSGWFVIWEETDATLHSRVIPSLRKLHITTNHNRLTVGVDMPVVLSDEMPREADQLARKQLGKKASTIFSAPTSGMLKQTSYEKACQYSKDRFGKAISLQSWHLFPKIRDVQTILSQAQIDIYEIHPELSFRSLNRNTVILESKKSAEGHKIRRQLLERTFSNFDFDLIRAQYLKKDVADDDILDALIVLWSTKRIAAGKAEFIPSHPTKANMRIGY